jgi:type I restriction enzyme S subunit
MSFSASPWSLSKLSEICGAKETVDPTRTPNVEFSYIDISSVSNTRFAVTEPKRIVGRDAPSRARKRVRSGDVIVATTRPYLKSIAQIFDELHGEVCSTGFCVLRPTQMVISDWLFFCSLSQEFIAQLTACMRGANYPAVTDSDVMEAKIPLPPVEEQRRIVARIKECMERVDEIERLRKASDHETKSLLRSFYREQYLSLSASNDAVALGKVGSISGGGTPSKQNPAFWNGDIPWVSPKDMKRRRLDSAEDRISPEAVEGSSVKLISKPSVIFVVRGMILAHTLPIAVTQVPLTINQDMKAITPFAEYEVEYIAAMMRGAESDLLQRVEVAGHGTRRLQTEVWSKFPIPVLPFSQQQSVIEKTAEMEFIVDSLVSEVPSAEVGLLRESILRKAFAGEL